jgi:RsiW-degrading membrane proteinase PrsW (M82 family)
MKLNLLSHLKEKGHAWVISLSIIVAASYLWQAILHRQTEQQITANVVLALVAAGTVVGGGIALVVMASLKKSQFGELAEFRTSVILGILVGVTVASIKLLSLFGVF